MVQPTDFKPLPNEYIDLAPLQEINIAEVFEKKISEIHANQIEIIAMDLIARIPPYLGPVAKVKLDQRIIQQKNFEALSLRECVMLAMQQRTCAQLIQQGNPVFFSDDEFGNFIAYMHWPMKRHIKDAFSIPWSFLEFGMTIQLSDYEPEEILREVGEMMGIKITAADVPRKYFILLSLDKELSQKQSTLVFVFSQWSDGIEFSRHTFTIENLEENYGDHLDGLS